MQNENIPIPPVFRRLDAADTVEVHDYEMSITDGCFGYVRQGLIGHAMPFPEPWQTVIVMRPVVSVLNILDMLQGDTCVCCLYKPRGRSHCPDCYKTLPPAEQRALYRRFRHGYEEAFLDSLSWLIGHGRTTVEKILAAVPKPKGAK